MRAHTTLALAIVLTLPAASLFAQSDTAEVRPSDLDFAKTTSSVRENIELFERRLADKTQETDQILRGLDLKQIEGQEMAKAALIELLNKFEEEADDISNAYEQLGPDLRLYREAILSAPAVFREFSGRLEEKASATESTFLKEAYADFAGQSRKLATKYEAKAKSVKGLEGDIAGSMKEVRESKNFIVDIREFLRAIPTDNGKDTAVLVARINEYVANLKQAIGQIQKVANEIGGDSYSGSDG